MKSMKDEIEFVYDAIDDLDVLNLAIFESQFCERFDYSEWPGQIYPGEAEFAKDLLKGLTGLGRDKNN